MEKNEERRRKGRRGASGRGCERSEALEKKGCISGSWPCHMRFAVDAILRRWSATPILGFLWSHLCVALVGILSPLLVFCRDDGELMVVRRLSAQDRPPICH